ncbi:MAG: glycolate oxidase subunit GlcE [Alphaproteobacteria bacterium]|nr:glycolate oxidase subunit GlcE [Alphaproteobacteria bacterium]
MSFPSTDILYPTDSAELEAVIGDALANHRSLEIVCGGSKRALGQAITTDQIVSLSELTGITLYEPEELVLTARAGTPLAEIEAALEEHNQQLAFEPPDWGPLLGTEMAQSLGGIVATNLAGPRRFQAGAVRDHVLGVSMVTGRGEAVKTGGRVVKNVTGYDLCKLISGSYGTLAVATDITVKVLPVGEKTRTVLIAGLDEADTVSVMTKALSSSYDVSAAAFLPCDLTAKSGVSYVSGAASSITAIRVEGPGPSVEARCLALRELLGAHGDVEELHFHNSHRFWQEIGNVSPFVEEAGQVWRVSVPPSEAAALVQKIQNVCDAEFYFDWGGGQIWLRLAGDHNDGGAKFVRKAIKNGGGHATLIRASEDVRSCVEVFQPQANGVKALNHRVKQGFDPGNILNPGRMELLIGTVSDAD